MNLSPPFKRGLPSDPSITELSTQNSDINSKFVICQAIMNDKPKEELYAARALQSPKHLLVLICNILISIRC
ncbi:unnamed protein product [Linum trigynum]|uniref:Uncharacterized protein n=1 Tax=Linum trigynum TaxID=586398 RepID=A0AAV2FAH9_9ROSI